MLFLFCIFFALLIRPTRIVDVSRPILRWIDVPSFLGFCLQTTMFQTSSCQIGAGGANNSQATWQAALFIHLAPTDSGFHAKAT
jgi:hypothetical protein